MVSAKNTMDQGTFKLIDCTIIHLFMRLTNIKSLLVFKLKL